MLSFEREEDGKVLCRVRDNLVRHEYQVRTKYMFACDGARSRVVQQLQIPLITKPAGYPTRSMVVKADLTNACASRQANLHWILQPEEEYPSWALLTCFRMVKPWTEYVY
jgi:2-polyprenyl-6-methoxyphenol hydroxylase-like FAD-dependent oxidoreductase